MSQQGKVALVTGGARGIGLSFVEHLLAEGAFAAICDIRKDIGEATVEELSKTYPKKVIYLLCDVTNEKQFEECFKRTVDRYGGLDIVINNAGVSDEWSKPVQYTVDINFNAVICGTRLGFKYMSKEEGGQGGIIVNIASTCSFQQCPSLPVYSATKAAVNQYSRSCGHDLFYRKSKVKVISINPGLTDTVFVKALYNSFNGHPDIEQNCRQNLNKAQTQKVDNLGKRLIQVLQNCENGSIWIIRNEDPAKLAYIK